MYMITKTTRLDSAWHKKGKIELGWHWQQQKYSCSYACMYKVPVVVTDLGWMDFDLGVPPPCPTQVTDNQTHPVEYRPNANFHPMPEID